MKELETKRKSRIAKMTTSNELRDYEVKEEIILRDFLALERTTLANERTLFAYIRTSLYLILAGIAFIELEKFETFKWLGYTLFSISSFLILFGIVRYFKLRKKLFKFYKSNRNQ